MAGYHSLYCFLHILPTASCTSSKNLPNPNTPMTMGKWEVTGSCGAGCAAASQNADLKMVARHPGPWISLPRIGCSSIFRPDSSLAVVAASEWPTLVGEGAHSAGLRADGVVAAPLLPPLPHSLPPPVHGFSGPVRDQSSLTTKNYTRDWKN